MKKPKFQIKPNRYDVDYDIYVDGKVVLTEVSKKAAEEMVRGAKEKLDEVHRDKNK